MDLLHNSMDLLHKPMDLLHNLMDLLLMMAPEPTKDLHHRSTMRVMDTSKVAPSEVLPIDVTELLLEVVLVMLR
ncbi:hypothetical protein GUJ93_ZPchr0010g8866 [Zizania palustris]|uniref:Uncharacterized protein n=1 Tax=Zizania palustris TaxID=103762 RepID=A0A8J5SZ09_ZIZPA|nr:hypothetical protein GUJ93_ZPchr0010g8866 [Zizania palustris]